MLESDSKREMRRRSMYGTVLLLLGVCAAVAAAVTGSAWLVGVAVVLLVPAIMMLYRVGKALS
jgi:hypothetical protein